MQNNQNYSMINNKEKQYWQKLKQELSYFSSFPIPNDEDNSSVCHEPIMADIILSYFKNNFEKYPNSIYIDGTLGEGGHSNFYLERYPKLKLIGLDQDINILGKAANRLQKYSKRIQLYHSNYFNIPSVIKENSIEAPSTVLLDLGISSFHLDEANRGFSYRDSMDLDMRLNDYLPLTATEILKSYTEKEIADIIFQYGEEGRSRKIARAIVRARAKKPFTHPTELADLMLSLIPTPSRKRHPAVKIFQALRIYINQELTILEQSLPAILDCLAPGSILAVISFHSLEDRIVKNIFRNFKQNKDFNILTKKPIIASEEELEINKRARSAKLRLIQKNTKDTRNHDDPSQK